MSVDVTVPNGGNEANFGRHGGVLGREVHAKHPGPSLVRGRLRPCQQNLPEAHVLVAWENLKRLTTIECYR